MLLTLVGVAQNVVNINMVFLKSYAFIKVNLSISLNK